MRSTPKKWFAPRLPWESPVPSRMRPFQGSRTWSWGLTSLVHLSPLRRARWARRAVDWRRSKRFHSLSFCHCGNWRTKGRNRFDTIYSLLPTLTIEPTPLLGTSVLPHLLLKILRPTKPSKDAHQPRISPGLSLSVYGELIDDASN